MPNKSGQAIPRLLKSLFFCALTISLSLWHGFKSLSTFTSPCPPHHSCEPWESCIWETVCLQVDWRWQNCEGWGTDMESGAVETRSAVYAALAMRLFSSDRKDLPVVATTPTPYRNDSWKQREGKKRSENKPSNSSFHVQQGKNHSSQSEEEKGKTSENYKTLLQLLYQDCCGYQKPLSVVFLIYSAQLKRTKLKSIKPSLRERDKEGVNFTSALCWC